MKNVYTYNQFKINENGDSYGDEVLIDRIDKKKKELDELKLELDEIDNIYKDIKSKYSSLINNIIKGSIPNIKISGKPTDGEITTYLKSNDVPGVDIDLILGYVRKVSGVDVMNDEMKKIESDIAELERKKSKNV